MKKERKDMVKKQENQDKGCWQGAVQEAGLAKRSRPEDVSRSSPWSPQRNSGKPNEHRRWCVEIIPLTLKIGQTYDIIRCKRMDQIWVKR